MRIFVRCLFLLVALLYSILALANNNVRIPILLYHNIDPTKHGSMTISTARFAEQLKYLVDNGYTVIPLKDAVSYLLGKNVALPRKPVVITADDGRDTVYKYMLPMIQKYRMPVTLFIYPSIISKEPYALTWEQLKSLQNTGLFTIEDHTWGHPNFRQERKRLSPAAYNNFVQYQFLHSKKLLESKLGISVTLLAWPFGIYNTDLEKAAEKAGYTMAFTIAGLKANRKMYKMAQPRYMIIQSQSMQAFAAMLR